MTRIHLSLQTADLDAATRFYTELFGAGPDKVREDYVRFQPADSPIALALGPGKPVLGAHHFGLKLAETAQVSAAHARLEKAGLVRSVETGTTCCHAVQDKFWLADPDGRAWEVYAVTDDLAPVAREDSSCCVDEDTSAGPGCCG